MSLSLSLVDVHDGYCPLAEAHTFVLSASLSHDGKVPP